jgi:hypothetical protein
MRNAQKNALMAMFTVMDEQRAERARTPTLPEPNTERPIVVDLVDIARRRVLRQGPARRKPRA